MQACHKEQSRPDDRDEHGLTEIGLHDQRHDRRRQQQQRKETARAGAVVRAPAFRKSPGGENDEGRLDEFGGLHAHDPAPRALNLRAEHQSENDQRHADGEDDQRGAPRMTRRKKRRRHHQ